MNTRPAVAVLASVALLAGAITGTGDLVGRQLRTAFGAASASNHRTAQVQLASTSVQASASVGAAAELRARAAERAQVQAVLDQQTRRLAAAQATATRAAAHARALAAARTAARAAAHARALAAARTAARAAATAAAAGAQVRRPTATTAPANEGLAARRDRILAGLQYPWRSLGFSVVFAPGRRGYLGLTDPRARTITVFVRPGQTDSQLRVTLAHELGHAVDLTYGSRARRADYLRLRGIGPGTMWWPCSACSDYSSGAGDFAEVFAVWLVGSTNFRSTLAGRPGAAELSRLSYLFRP